MGRPVVAAEAWRSELSVAAGKVGIAAVVFDEDGCEGCEGIAETAVAAAVASWASAEREQCADGEETWESEEPPHSQPAC